MTHVMEGQQAVVTPAHEDLIVGIAETLSARDINNGDDIHQQAFIRGIGVVKNNPDKPIEELKPMLVSAMVGERREFYRSEMIAQGVSRNTQDSLKNGTQTEHDLVSRGRTIGGWISLEVTGDQDLADINRNDQVLDKVLADEMIDCFDESDPKDARLKQVLVNYFFKDLSLAEIAEDLGVTEGRVSQLLSQAKQCVRDRMDIQV